MSTVDANGASVRQESMYLFAYLSVLAVLAWLVGSRDFSRGVDTINYVSFYRSMRSCGCFSGWHEPGFELVTFPVAILKLEPSAFLIWMSGVGMYMMWHVSRLAGEHVPRGRARTKITALIICLFLVSPLFISAQINAIRQGMAAMALIALAIHLHERRKKKAFLWGAIAVSLHLSSAMYLVSLLLLPVSPVVLYGTFTLSFIFYVSGLSESVVQAFSSFSGVPLYQMVNEYGASADYAGGVKLEFALASLAFLFIGLIIKLVSRGEVRGRIDWFVRIYVCFILPFLWLGWGNFSNRYAYTAWFMMSVIGGLGLYSHVRRVPRLVFLVAVVVAGVVFITGIQP